MKKNEARSLFTHRREAMDRANKLKWDELLLIQFQTIELGDLDFVLSYYPIAQNNEPDTFTITDYLHFRNPHIKIGYPRADLEAGTFAAIVSHADSIFQANAYNILEPTEKQFIAPEDLDLVLVPLLGFDLNGTRVGYGKGFYDRYLKNCREECLKIGLCYFEPVDTIEDATDFDVPLDICITPHQIYVF
ncbi:MAG: 5-formyltetrahydrofolate cyclo-ligase [Flavisolibacter sp.]